MKKILLIIVLAFTSFNLSATAPKKIPVVKKQDNVKVLSVRFMHKDNYEKEIPCVVTLEVGGNTVVGYGSGMTEREACDKAYQAARNYL